jgi:outer membrane protein TolC
MNRRILSLLCLLLLVLMQGQAAHGAEPLSLEKALSLAAVNNPVLAAGRQRIAQARERIHQAGAPALPQLGVSLLYQTAEKDPFHPVFIGGQQVGYAQAGFRTTWKAALTLSQLIYSGGAVRYSVDSRRLALEGVEAAEKRTAQGVEWAVTSAWYDLRRSVGRLSVAEETLSLAKEHLRQVQALFRNGVVAKNDVLRVEVSVAEAELGRIRAMNAVDVAWHGLSRAVGTSLRPAFTLPAEDAPGDFSPLPSDPVAEGLASRPEMRALDRAMHSALFAAKAARASGGPRVVLFGEIYRADETFFPSKMDDWKITLQASWTFFDGGESSSRAREAKAAAEELLHQAEDLKRQIELEISVARTNFESSLRRIEVGKAMVAAAEEDYRMALKRYVAQVGTNIDVLDASVALANARNQLVEGLYDSKKARVEIDWAMGSTGKAFFQEAEE